MAAGFRDLKLKARAPSEPVTPQAFPVRRWLVLAATVVAALGLGTRAAMLQTSQKEFLQGEGVARHLRVVRIPAHRGVITDRHGQALAISTAVDSVWAIPRQLATQREQWPALARLLSLDVEQLHRVVAERIDREFVYLRRHIAPDLAEAVRALEVAGVHLEREYRRYYPAGEVAAHVIGFTDIDDQGQEGIELAFDRWLGGVGGAKQVIQDRLGRFVEDVANVTKARPGQDMRISMDLRIQTLAYRSLKEAVRRHRALGGSLVVLDARTGEVLAMVNQPSYNPNRRESRTGAAARNRAVTDVIEPGSTAKPFTVAAALETGTVHAGSSVDTSPGSLRVGRHVIRDRRDLGLIDVVTVLARSSNVGATKIALATPPEALWRVFSEVGFGQTTASGFPGESAGILTRGPRWTDLERATLSFGYGLSVTPLQLTQAYLVLANRGRLLPVSFVPRAADLAPPPGVQVIPERVARQVSHMLESVVSTEGSGRRAEVAGYRVAGKTGTSRKAAPGGYSEDRHTALFAGIAPASDPRLAMVVVIDEPQGDEYYGGEVAAPVFADVAAGALRLLGVPPDHPGVMAQRIDLTSASSRPHSGRFSPPSFSEPSDRTPGDRG